MPAWSTAQIAKAAGDPIVDPHILLVELTEDHISGTMRLARNNEDVVSNGETYTALNFDVMLPGASGKEPRARLETSNVLRLPGRLLLLKRFPIRVRLMLVDMADPDTALIDTGNLYKCTGWGIDGERVQLDLKPAVSWREPYPPQRTSRPLFPAVWMTR